MAASGKSSGNVMICIGVLFCCKGTYGHPKAVRLDVERGRQQVEAKPLDDDNCFTQQCFYVIVAQALVHL